MPSGQPGTSEHGTNSMYTNLGCRCEPCRAAHAAYYRTLYRQGKVIAIKFWGEEARLIQGAARSAGMTTTEWLRTVVADRLALVDSEPGETGGAG